MNNETLGEMKIIFEDISLEINDEEMRNKIRSALLILIGKDEK